MHCAAIRGPRLVLTLLALICMLQMCTAESAGQLSDALAGVQSNLKTPAGRHYAQLIQGDFSMYLLDLRQCKTEDAPPGVLDLFLLIKSDGKVNEAMLYPDSSEFSTCARKVFLSAKFSPPPHDDYWVNIRMQFKKQNPQP